MRADIEGDLEKIKKEKNMYVGVVQNEAKIVIPGCLVSGANGMLFSFDQSVWYLSFPLFHLVVSL